MYNKKVQKKKQSGNTSAVLGRHSQDQLLLQLCIVLKKEQVECAAVFSLTMPCNDENVIVNVYKSILVCYQFIMNAVQLSPEFDYPDAVGIYFLSSYKDNLIFEVFHRQIDYFFVTNACNAMFYQYVA